MALKVAVAGGGVGGMAVAIALQNQGHAVTIFEQARAYGRIGADVNLTPNAVHALDHLGLGGALRRTAARPEFRISRMWDSGDVTSKLPMSAAAEKKYGAPQLTIHRADLLDALQAALKPDTLRFGARVSGVRQDETGATLQFEDGSDFNADLVIGADGIHSAVRHALYGADAPKFTGLVSYRGTFPRDAAPDLPNLDSFTKWWGPVPELQIVTFPLNQGREIFVFATTGQKDWTEEGWTLPGDIEELRAIYKDFHPEARALLSACTNVTRSALHVRAPMARWSEGRVVLLGDAAHPMVPFMAQGACMASEDAIVLARAVEGVGFDALPEALERYAQARIPRTTRVQEGSLANDWLKKGGNADWVYGYDAWRGLEAQAA
ncbi:FAD-dependent monooxygenase [Leisingera methylohalidivorans]|nr:FAD-dependent monooxygenase [Leisingera methylohalidivorans]